MKRWATLVGLVLLLSSCAVPSPYPPFDREATDADALPEVFYQSEFDGYNSSYATRFAGEVDGIGFYLIKTEPTGSVCVAVDAGANSIIACGGAPGVSTSGPGYRAELSPAPVEPREGWTVLGDNLLVQVD